jgi:hypothetical protein
MERSMEECYMSENPDAERLLILYMVYTNDHTEFLCVSSLHIGSSNCMIQTSLAITII